MKRAASAESASDISRKSCCTDSSTESKIVRACGIISPLSGVDNLEISSTDEPQLNAPIIVDTVEGSLDDENGQIEQHLNGISAFNKGTSLLVQRAMDEEITEKVAILDFGSQYGKVIDRRVRESSVYSEILPLSVTAKELMDRKFSCIIISGGPKSVYADNAPKYDPEIFNIGLPILGICYGFQLINKDFGGHVAVQPFREDNQVLVKLKVDCSLFEGLKTEENVLLTHGDCVLPSNTAPNFQIIAETDKIVAGIANEKKKIYGLQFHPEVDLTDNGHIIFDNFLRKIVGLKATYTLINRESYCLEYIREQVGNKKVLVMVSGGVDSTVCAALLRKALGPDRVIAVHIDNGFMRHNESKLVVEALNSLGLNVNCYPYMDSFFDAQVLMDKQDTPLLLSEVVDPEQKRAIIGDTFIHCKDKIVNELSLDTDMFFAQGTLRPDLIESASNIASGMADVIKTHHNDTELVRQLRNLGRVVEPLKDFHKDEVRDLGRKLGLPESIVNRHPFPGPGLAIRIMCAERPFIEDNYFELSERISDITDGFCDRFDFNFKIYSTLLPIRTVGVQGDCRTYSYAVALSTDYRPVPWRELDLIAGLIPTEVPQVNRVCYVYGHAIKHTIREITITKLTEGVIKKLRRADRIVNQVLNGHNEKDQPVPGLQPTMNLIQQMPVVLIPVQFNKLDGVSVVHGTFLHSVVLRPFITRDFMTGRNALPGRDIPEEVFQLIVHRIMSEVNFISRVLIDLTSKPPGTTEWE